jgi:hypothetical protein
MTRESYVKIEAKTERCRLKRKLLWKQYKSKEFSRGVYTTETNKWH